MKNNSHPTSWQPVASWYNKITGEGGHYYHQHVVIPGVLKLLSLRGGSKLLDLACGNGVSGKAIPKDIEYVGVDIAESLISEAKRSDKNPKHKYLVGDVTNPLSISSDFTHASIVLALQKYQRSD